MTGLLPASLRASPSFSKVAKAHVDPEALLGTCPRGGLCVHLVVDQLSLCATPILAVCLYTPPLRNVHHSEIPHQAVRDQLFNERQFRGPTYGRSNVPFNSMLDHPGIWENASQAYLHEVLIRKKGIAATLAIIFAQVRQSQNHASLCAVAKPPSYC